jgi:hypothetical protein
MLRNRRVCRGAAYELPEQIRCSILVDLALGMERNSGNIKDQGRKLCRVMWMNR